LEGRRLPLTGGVAVFPAERHADEAAFTDDDDDVAPGVRMALASRGALFPAKRVGDRASQGAFTDDDDDVPQSGRAVALGAAVVFPAEAEGDGDDVANREEAAAFTDDGSSGDAGV